MDSSTTQSVHSVFKLLLTNNCFCCKGACRALKFLLTACISNISFVLLILLCFVFYSKRRREDSISKSGTAKTPQSKPRTNDSEKKRKRWVNLLAEATCFYISYTKHYQHFRMVVIHYHSTSFVFSTCSNLS